MKLKLMLWWLGVMLKRARSRKAAFRDALEKLQQFDWGVATEDLTIAATTLSDLTDLQQLRTIDGKLLISGASSLQDLTGLPRAAPAEGGAFINHSPQF